MKFILGTKEKMTQVFTKGLIETGINVIDHGLGLVFFMYFSQMNECIEYPPY